MLHCEVAAPIIGFLMSCLLICTIQALPSKNVLEVVGQTALQRERQVLVFVTEIIELNL